MNFDLIRIIIIEYEPLNAMPITVEPKTSSRTDG